MFLPGNPGGPGRPKGSLGGRARVLLALDAMLAEEEEVSAMKEALRAYMHKDRVRFFRQIIMPLLPQDIRLRLGEEGAIKWASLLTTFPTEPSASSTTIDITDSAPSVVEGAGARPALPPPNSSTSPESAEASSPG